MRITINTANFISAIKSLEKLNIDNTLTILDSVKITSDYNNITLTKTNMSKTIIAKISAYVETLGSIIIPNKTVNIIKNIKENEFILTDDSIITDKRIIKFSSLNLSEYPEVNNNIKESFFEITEQELNRMLEVKYCVSNDENRPALTGICFDENRVIGCDGFRMSIRQGSYNSNLKMVIVDPETIDLISKIINKKSNNIVKIYGQSFTNENKQFIKFVFDNVEVIGETISGVYLNYKSIIPSDFETIIEVNTEDISNEIEFISKSISEKNEKVIILAKDNKITIDCSITEKVYDKEASRKATQDAQHEADLIYYEAIKKMNVAKEKGKTIKVPKQKTVKEVKKYQYKEVNKITSNINADITGNQEWKACFNNSFLYEGFKFYNGLIIIKAISSIAPILITKDNNNLEFILPVRINL